MFSGPSYSSSSGAAPGDLVKTSRSISGDLSNGKRNTSNALGKPSTKKSPFIGIKSYMSEKNRKLRAQFEASAYDSDLNDGIGLFHGVSIFVDGFTVPSSQELKGYMLRHGGRFENYFSRRRVTHIICSHLADKKVKNLRAFSRGLPVVKPEWVLDSVAANKLISWIPYKLYQLSNKSHKQQKLSSFFSTKSISTSKVEDVPLHSQMKNDNEPLLFGDEKLEHFVTHEHGECAKLREKVNGYCAQSGYQSHENLYSDMYAKPSIIGQVHIDTIMETFASHGRLDNENKNVKESSRVELLEAPHQQDLVSRSDLTRDSFKSHAASSLCMESNVLDNHTGSGGSHDLMPLSLSQVNVSIFEHLPKDLKMDILQSLPAHRTVNCTRDLSSSFMKNLPSTIGNKNSENSMIQLWVGTPPNWVKCFKLSNCVILNVISDLYPKQETEGPLSGILQSVVPYIPLLDSSEFVWNEALSCMFKLFKEYIELKIEEDIEELYVCFKLLRRFRKKSKLLSEVYKIVLPFLQGDLWWGIAPF